MERPKRLFFPFEVPVVKEVYEQSPVRIIRDFLDCIDSDGVQTVEFPPHVIEAMASRLRRVIDPDHSLNSLDEAFGGRIARQRNALLEEEKTGEIVFDHIIARMDLKKAPRSERGGTPFEVAAEQVAKRLGTSDENVKRRYKKAAKR